MNLLERARIDYRTNITAEGTAGIDILFENKTATETALVKGIGMSHHLSFDTDGQTVNSRKSFITVSELDLTNVGYTVRNLKNEVSLFHHKVKFTDSAGIERLFFIKQAFPDETFGIITCILSING